MQVYYQDHTLCSNFAAEQKYYHNGQNGNGEGRAASHDNFLSHTRPHQANCSRKLRVCAHERRVTVRAHARALANVLSIPTPIPHTCTRLKVLNFSLIPRPHDPMCLSLGTRVPKGAGTHAQERPLLYSRSKLWPGHRPWLRLDYRRTITNKKSLVTEKLV